MNPTRSFFNSFHDLQDWLDERSNTRWAEEPEMTTPTYDPRLPMHYTVGARQCPNRTDKSYSTICQIVLPQGENLCPACKAAVERRLVQSSTKPRIRTLNGTERPCKLTPGCSGTMKAHLRLSADNDPELWWTCMACSHNGSFLVGECEPAKGAMSIIRSRPENINRKKFLNETMTAYTSEAREQADHINSIMTADDGSCAWLNPTGYVYRESCVCALCAGARDSKLQTGKCIGGTNPNWVPKTTCNCERCSAWYHDGELD